MASEQFWQPFDTVSSKIISDQFILNTHVRCGMAFPEAIHCNKLNITYFRNDDNNDDGYELEINLLCVIMIDQVIRMGVVTGLYLCSKFEFHWIPYRSSFHQTSL